MESWIDEHMKLVASENYGKDPETTKVRDSCEKASSVLFNGKTAFSNHLIEGHAQGGKTFLYTHFKEAKALFSYINPQVTDSIKVIRGKIIHNFSCRGMSRYSLQVRAWRLHSCVVVKNLRCLAGLILEWSWPHFVVFEILIVVLEI